MIIDSTSRKYQVILTAAKTTNNMSIVVNWEPVSKMPNLTPKLERTSSNGVTAVDILATTDLPKRITSLTIYNNDTAAKTVQVLLNDTGTAFTIVSATLQPGEMLGYSEATQWHASSPVALLEDTIHAATAKSTPVTDDEFGIWDSVSLALRKVTYGNLITTLQTAFASLSFSAATINGATISTPNAALNPDLDIAQRGTSFVSPINGAYDLDGWSANYVSSAVIDVAQGTGNTTGSFSRQCTVTTADAAIAAGDLWADQHRITGYDAVSYDLIGNTFTVAFWEKFPVTGTHCAALKNSGNDRSYVHEFNVTAANTWAEYQFTVTGGLPTAGTWNYTTGIGLRLFVTHACGSTFQTASVDQWVTGNYFGTSNQVNDLATVGNVWAISKLRINKGTQPTSAATSRDNMLVRCRARCIILPVAIPASTDSPVTVPINMLATPTISGGGAGFASTGTTKDALICYQTSRATATLTLTSEI